MGYECTREWGELQIARWFPLGSSWVRLMATALLVGPVSILEAISIARALAERHDEKLEANTELLGQYPVRERVRVRVHVLVRAQCGNAPMDNAECACWHVFGLHTAVHRRESGCQKFSSDKCVPKALQSGFVTLLH